MIAEGSTLPESKLEYEETGLPAGGAGGGSEYAEAAPVRSMPDVLPVTVRADDGSVVNTVFVKIVRDYELKPYIGGYRNKATDTIFHNATTQTTVERKSKWDGRPPAFCRETQTVTTLTRSQQTTREGVTQMARPDLYLDTSGDRTLAPKKYFSADKVLALRAEKAQILQNHWRGYCARKEAWEARERLHKAREEAAIAADEEARKAEAAHAAEVHRRMHPRSSTDFEILYNELEAWRDAETRRINSEITVEKDRLEALAQLLHKETKLLQTIDRLKLTATKDNREKRIQAVLELMSAPKLWELSTGAVTAVHTPFTTRAKELSDLYNGLQMPLSVEERLEVLLHVKWTVKQFDCQLTREICELVDRESDLLNRGRSEKSVEGLRKRISNLFLQFLETPEFNPEAARYSRVALATAST